MARGFAGLGIVAGIIILLLALKTVAGHYMDPDFTGGQAAVLAGFLIFGVLLSGASYVLYRYYGAKAKNSDVALERSVQTLANAGAEMRQAKPVDRLEVQPPQADNQTKENETNG